MKRAISVMLVFCCVILCGCGKPKGMSDAVYDLGVSALDATDAFLSGSASAVDAASAVSSASEQLSDIENSPAELLLSVAVSKLSRELDVAEIDADYNNTLDLINELAELTDEATTDDFADIDFEGIKAARDAVADRLGK